MSTHSKVDPDTLGWVKHEIDETLKQARLALEAFAENPSDTTRLRFCATHLHQVVGTLLMVELDGAALIAREAEALIEDLVNDKIKSSDELLDVLTRSILTLPDYLSRLQAGQPDLPRRHLALLNELRGARKAEPIAEIDLFSPDLSVRPLPAPELKLAEPEFQVVARQLRPAYQAALLEWLRASDHSEALTRFGEQFQRLQVHAPVPQLEQLFWVAGALVEALAEGGLQAGNDRKKLFARIDQQIKRIIDGGERSMLRSTAEALTKSILFEIAQATSKGERVSQIKTAFHLIEMFGEAAPADLEAFDLPTPEVLQSVSNALAKEIETAQEWVTAYFDPERRDAEALERLDPHLKKMSSTLDMLGVPILKALIDELRATVQALASGGIADPKSASMPVAQAFLLVEGSAREIHKSASEWRRQIERGIGALRAVRAPETTPAVGGIEVAEAELTESEYKQLLNVVAGEVGVNLGKIEEALEAYAADPARTDHLEEVPQHLSQIEGALQILGVEKAGELAAATRGHVESLRTGDLTGTSAILDGLAVCVGTIGAYIEGLRAGRRNLDQLVNAALSEMNGALAGAGRAELGAAREATDDPASILQAIRGHIDAWLSNQDDRPALEGLYRELADIGRLAKARGNARLERLASEMNNLLHLVTANPETLTQDIVTTLEQSYAAMETLVGEELEAAVPDAEGFVLDDEGEPFAAPGFSVEESAAAHRGARLEPIAEPEAEPAFGEGPIFADSDDVIDGAPSEIPEAMPLSQPETSDSPEFDAEILEIFIEDSRDVLQNVGREFKRWKSDPDNADALAEVRRAYHTLKGSGRMVGANAIGELAWSVENVLNKIRERKLAPSQDVFGLVEETLTILPKMVDELAGGAAARVDVESIKRRAEEIAMGRGARRSSAARTEAEYDEAPIGGGEDLPRLDRVLLDIFSNEARGHLATIRQELAAYREAGGVGLVTEPLFRATHTLGGNARSLGLEAMSQACAEGERLLNAVKTQEHSLEGAHIELFEVLESAVTQLVEALNNGGADGAGVQARFRELTNRFRDEHLRLDGASPPPRAARTEAKPSPPPRPAAPVSSPTPALRAAPPAGELVHESVDPELMEIFREEAVDILATVEEALSQWRARPENSAVLQELKRGLHTLKGGARMAGAVVMGNLSHLTETLVKQVEEKHVAASNEVFDALEEAHDALVSMLERVAQGQPVANPDELIATISGLTGVEPPAARPAPPSGPREPVAASEMLEIDGGHEAEWENEDAAANSPARLQARQPEPTPPSMLVERGAGERAAARDDDDAAVPGAAARDRSGLIRVRTNLLNELVNYAGEVSISRSRMEQQIYGFRDSLSELNRNVTRFRDQIRELEIQSESQILYRMETQAAGGAAEFDPLEFDRFSRLQQLSRQLSESLHDLSTIQGNLGNFVGEAEAVLAQQARLNTDLQEGLMRTRMVSFMTQAGRLRHIVRSTARELGKRVELNLTGSEIEIDRTVLERMIGPFEHMIRNSIDHGIESESERRRRGKPPVGRITVNTGQEGSEIVLTFSDDGAGLNTKAIREKAVERGLVSADATLSEEELYQFILISGFSTAQRITHVSGRGVGMDVVHNEVKQLGGTMTVDSKSGEGTTFVIRLPLTLSITQALMVHVGDQIFAVPLASVGNIIEYPVDKLDRMSVGKNPLLNHEDRVYPYMNLAARLGLTTQARNGKKAPILLARAGNREIAVKVDGLGGTREIVIKTLGAQLSALKGIAGATVRGDGSVILILDIPGLWYTDDTMHLVHRVEEKPAVRTAGEHAIVMVVDDSLTVRKITGKHLQKRGLEVMVAKDGVDAVEQLRDRIPDLMLVDIEMPRMDGYELTTRVRNDERLKHIPIIMITSRAGAKHRQRAFQLGVDMYMSKPYQEEELFTNIDTLLARGRAQ